MGIQIDPYERFITKPFGSILLVVAVSKTISNDGFWQFEDGEWIATEMQKEALQQGARPHNEITVLSEDGFWELIDNDWKPSQKQKEALNKGATPHNVDLSYNLAPTPIGTLKPKLEVLKIFSELEPQHKIYLISGMGFLALLISIIIVVASISLEAMLEDEIKDSDGDGILDNRDAFPNDASETMDSDMDGVGDSADVFPNDAGETMDADMDGVGDNSDVFPNDDSETMDTDVDGIGDNSDSCVNGKSNWNSDSETDYDSDGCHDSSEDIDDDNDGWTDLLESSCNSNSTNSSSIPLDADEDGICNLNEQDNFEWTYNSQEYSIYLPLERSVYNYYKNENHTIVYEMDYIRHSTPEAPYVILIAGLLEQLAIEEGYTSMIDKAEFILAFVGAIPYILEGEGEEYPKYPIEMLWENGGDCEDSSALYISIMEALGYDAILILLEVKANEADEWGGHAMVGISIPGYSGEEWFLVEGSDTKYFDAETTAWYDEYDEIGINPWYELQNLYYYEV